MASAQTAAGAGTFNFTFTVTTIGGVASTGNVIGTLTTNASGIVTAITGTSSNFANANLNSNIQSLLAVGAYGGNDNKLFSSNPNLNANGFSYTLANGFQENLYYSATSYRMIDNAGVTSVFGTFTSDVTAAPVPAPLAGGGSLSWLTAALALAAAGLWRWRQPQGAEASA